MASELQIQASLKFNKSGASINFDFPATLFDVAGSSGIENVISVGITDETLALGDVSTIGYVAVKNLETLNFITLGPDGSVYPIKLKPGEVGLFRWNGAAIHAIADTAPCKLAYFIIPN